MVNYKIKTISVLFSTVVFIVLFFLSPESMIKGMNNGLKLCAAAIIPSLFPFMVISDYVIRSGLAEAAGRFTEGVSRLLFKLPGSAGVVVIMSMVGGYPIGAKMTAQLLENGNISTSQAKRMMLFCVNSGPAFVIGTVGTIIFSSRKAGVILYLSMVISSVMMGYALRFFDSEDLRLNKKRTEIKTGTMMQSVANGVNSMLNLCACVLLFSCLISMAESLLLPEEIMIWVKMCAEVTYGCRSAAGVFPLSIQTLIMGFGGFSVHFQLMSYIKQTEVKYLHFFISRIFHGGLSACVANFLFKLFPCQANVFSTNTQVMPKLYSVSIPAAVSMLCLAVFLVTELTVKFRQNKNDEA